MNSFASAALIAPAMALAVIVWNVVISGWITSRNEGPKPFNTVTAICGMMVAPAVVIAVASGTEAGARTIVGITWIVPVLSMIFVLQVAMAIVMRIVSPVLALPVLLYNIAVALAAAGDYLVSSRGHAPAALQAMVAARDVVIGFSAGRVALVSPLALLVPMIVPAYEARWRVSSVVRAIAVLGATAIATLLVIEWPRGFGAVSSYSRAQNLPMARPSGDFLVGVRLFPVLRGPPPAHSASADLAIVDSIKPDIVFLLIDSEGTRAAALDSLARSLELIRSDSVIVAAALVNKRELGDPAAASRALAIERILQTIRPDVFFPAFAPPIPYALPSRTPDIAWWRTALVEGARTVERVRPRTKVAWAASRVDGVDSSIYAWAVSPRSTVDIVGVVSFPSFYGLSAIDARLRAVDRWRNTALNNDAVSRPHWIAIAGGLPQAHGDVSQSASILHAAAWGSRRQWVNAIIVGEPADYTGRTGLRASNGRHRAAVATAGRLVQVMRDSRATP